MDTISWRAPEHIHTEKTSDWYWIVGIVTISLAVIAILFNDVIFAILIVVSVMTLSLYATKKPEIVQIEITNTGVYDGNTFYPYTELDSFWIETREAHPKLLMKSKKKLMFLIAILLEDADPEAIVALVSQHIPKIEHREPLLEKIFVWMGF